MQNSKMINELFALRAIACLSIVFLHAIDTALFSVNTLEIRSAAVYVFDSINLFLYFGTPMFIFMSELIIVYSYRNKKIPDHFLAKRVKFILIPFLLMAVFYSIPYMGSFSEWSTKVFLNAVIGDFHGYFVLIIFQFYILHLLLHRFLKKWNPKVVLSVSLLINISYLAYFNFSTPPSFLFAEYIWTRYYWVPFLGWIFYFTLGYYCGYYYENFLALIKKYKNVILIAPVFSTGILLFLYHSELVSVHSSKRIDIIFHTTVLSLFLFYVTNRLRKIPEFLIKISQYSFGIYLLHMFYISVADFIYQLYPVKMGIYYIFLLFFSSLILSMLTIYYMNQWKFGQYFVGKIGIGKRNVVSSGKPVIQAVHQKEKPLPESS